jgi:hypothetical protein
MKEDVRIRFFEGFDFGSGDGDRSGLGKRLGYDGGGFLSAGEAGEEGLHKNLIINAEIKCGAFGL